MKKLVLCLGIVSLSILSGCDPSVLNVPPGDEITQDQIWNDEALLEAYVNDIYRGIGHGYNGVELSSGVDETKHVHGWGDATVRLSNFTPDDYGLFDDIGSILAEFRWVNVFSHIRKINILLENIDQSTLEQDVKDSAKGSALFLRAYYYHNLLKSYGGVPILKASFSLDSENFLVSRDPFADVVDFIVSDLDQAATLLEGGNSSGNKARASVGSALTLKSRVLLYAASDLFDDPSGENAELLGYTNGSQMERWRVAKNAAQAVMEFGAYELYAANPAPEDSTAKNYADIWLQNDHSEMIFIRQFTEDQGGWDPGWAQAPDIGLYHGPNGYHNWGGDVPTQQMIDAYQMADGSNFEWNNSVHADNPYENRDPRFYASIFYNGSHWRERPNDVIDQDPVGIVETAYFEVQGQEALRPGLDTRDGPVEDWNGTYTGYYMRKFLDINVNHQFDMQTWPYIFMRYAEVLLNYAEASIELNELADARDAINEVRERAGMPDITETDQATLRDLYRNERRIELAFERHRYWDVRRWKIAPNAYENGMGVQIIGRLQQDGSYDFEYNLQQVDERGWNDKAYFLPIPRSEIQANDQLIQNPGYN